MTATVTQDVQEQVLGAIRKSQEVTLDAVKKIVETVAAAQAKLPAALRPAAEHEPTAPADPAAE